MQEGRGVNNNDIIFGRKTAALKPKIITQSNNQIKPKRKKRSDAKHDIKFKLSADDKKLLRLKAMDHNLSLTAFASLIVKNDLLRNREYQKFEYDNNGFFIHVVLEHDYFEMVKTLSVEWDLSYRRVVHRIVKDYLWRSSGGVSIYSE